MDLARETQCPLGVLYPLLRSHIEKDNEIEKLAFFFDDGTMQTNLDPYSDGANMSFEANYGCSIWMLHKMI
jgi:hypothetical protein